METPGVPWWQVAGGFAAVFALLVLFLKLLGRLPRGGEGGRAGLLAVWPVGPRREVQVLRVLDEVHYLYRQDGALVHLRREPLAAWQAARPAAAAAEGDVARRLRDALLSRLPGRDRRP